MKEMLDKIRTPNKEENLRNKIINTVLILLLGIIVGAFSKWLDNLSNDNNIWWQSMNDS